MPPRRPGPKSKTQPREDQQEEEQPAAPPPPREPSSARSESVSYPSKVFRCKICGRVFADRRDLGLHKLSDHADAISHLTSSTVGAPTMREGVPVPVVPPRPLAESTPTDSRASRSPRRAAPTAAASKRPPGGGDPDSDKDSEPEPGPSRPPRSPRRPQASKQPPRGDPGSDEEAEAGPSRAARVPRRPAANSRRDADDVEVLGYVDEVPDLPRRGRNPAPKLHGKRRRVRGADGVERIEYDRSPRSVGA